MGAINMDGISLGLSDGGRSSSWPRVGHTRPNFGGAQSPLTLELSNGDILVLVEG